MGGCFLVVMFHGGWILVERNRGGSIVYFIVTR